MEGEGGIGAVRHHHVVAGIAKGAYHQAQQIVDADAEHDVVARNVVAPGEGVAQHEAFGIAISIDPRRGLAHGGERLGRGAEGAFIGADPKRQGPADAALQRLG